MLNKIEKLFEVAGYPNYKDLEINKFYKPKKNIEISTFKEGRKVYRKVNAVVYKGLCNNGFIISSRENSEFKVTPLHKIYDASKRDFVTAGEIWEELSNTTEKAFQGMDDKGKIVNLTIRKCEETFPVLDLEVEDTHTYFSQGVLSHNTFGSGAGANGRIIKRMNYFVDKYQCPVLWISQERANQNPMAHLNSLTGGFAVNFYPSTRFRVTAKEPITVNGEIVGTKIKLKNYKNKTGQPFRECTVDVYYHDGPTYKAGMDAEGQYLDMLLELGLVQQRGAWFFYRENDPDESRRVRAQGFNGLKEYFETHPDDFNEVKELINKKMSSFDADLDKNSVETNELEEIKLETKAAAERTATATAALAEEALKDASTGEA